MKAPRGPASGFGKEKTAADYRARIKWERWAAAEQRKIGHEAHAQGHDLTRMAYKELLQGNVSDRGLSVAVSARRAAGLLGRARVISTTKGYAYVYTGSGDPMRGSDELWNITEVAGARPAQLLGRRKIHGVENYVLLVGDVTYAQTTASLK